MNNRNIITSLIFITIITLFISFFIIDPLKTKPDKTESPSIAVISNPSISDSVGIRELDRTIDYFNSTEDIDFVIFMGNLTSGGTENQIKLIYNSISNLDIRYGIILGNLDLSTDSSMSSFMNYFGHIGFYFKVDNYHIGGISTTSDKPYGVLNDQSNSVINDIRKRCDDGSNIFLFSYFNFSVDNNGGFDSNSLFYMLNTFKGYKFLFVDSVRDTYSKYSFGGVPGVSLGNSFDDSVLFYILTLDGDDVIISIANKYNTNIN